MATAATRLATVVEAELEARLAGASVAEAAWAMPLTPWSTHASLREETKRLASKPSSSTNWSTWLARVPRQKPASAMSWQSC